MLLSALPTYIQNPTSTEPMTSIFRTLSVSFALTLTLFCNHAAAQTEPVDSIVALVEDDVILRSELDMALANIRRQYAGKESQLPPQKVLEKQILERLVVGKLQVLRAEETGVVVTDTEVDQAVARVAASNKLTTEQLANALVQDGLNLRDFRTNMREELLTQKLRTRVSQSRSEVSESEIDILLASGKLKSGEIKIAHILVALPDNASNEQLETAKRKIDGIKSLIDEKKIEFSAAAIRYSDAEQALEGGVIGWRRFDQIPAAFSDALTGLKPGEVTQPIRSQSGLHILTVLETREDSQVMVTEYNARHIMIRTDELTSDAQAEKGIENIAETIAKGGDFAEQAKKLSNDAQTAALGGDMGWFELDAYGSTYAETIAALKDNELSKPFRTEMGWHLVQRLGQRTLDRTKDYARNQARESIRARKADDAFQQFIRQLRNESFVETRLEGMPSDEAIATEEESAEVEAQIKRAERAKQTGRQ